MLLYGTSADELLMPCILVPLGKLVLLSCTSCAEVLLSHLSAFRLQSNYLSLS